MVPNKREPDRPTDIGYTHNSLLREVAMISKSSVIITTPHVKKPHRKKKEDKIGSTIDKLRTVKPVRNNRLSTSTSDSVKKHTNNYRLRKKKWF